MKTRNYNDRLSRRIVTAMLSGPMTVEQISSLNEMSSAPKTEAGLHHALACLRYGGTIIDQGTVWQLTEAGREYANWCKQFPQRPRRITGQESTPALTAAFPPVLSPDADEDEHRPV